MKFIKITKEMAQMFRDLRESSSEPTFKIMYYGEVTHGCKVIQKSKDAVFVHVRSFSDCGGFWMPLATYQTLKDGFVKIPKNAPFDLNYNQTYYQYQ